MQTPIRWSCSGLVATLALALASASCGSAAVTDSRAPVLVIVNSLIGGTGTQSAVVTSDVIVMRTSPAPCTTDAPCPTIFNDPGTAVIGVTMKNTTVTPTTNNQVTINRYHVSYERADGQNRQGIDVPYGFDGAVNATIIPGQTTSVGFELVRNTAKDEAPLVQLRSSSNFIYTIATVTFFGTDAVGNSISAAGKISVNFGNYADSQ